MSNYQLIHMTTVTINDETHRKLKKLKKLKGAASFNELLESIAEKELQVPSSEELFGSSELKDREKVREHKDRSERRD